MVTFECRAQAPSAVEADVIAVFAAKGEDGLVLGRDAVALGAALGLDLAQALASIRYEGAVGAVGRIPTGSRTPRRKGQAVARQGKAPAGQDEAAAREDEAAARQDPTVAPLILVAGLGKPDGQRGPAEALRRAAGACARQATRDATLAIVVPGDLPDGLTEAERARIVAEGAGLGAYAFTAYRTKLDDLPRVERIVLLPGEALAPAAVEAGLRQAEALVAATCLARDLVNTPPADKRPPALAERMAEAATAAGLAVTIHDERMLSDGGFGGILGVGQGSSAPPRLVELTYEPDGANGHVVLVGKGITFDSGGLSLKTPGGMSTMKSDMAGGAAVLGAMTALPALGVPVKVTGLVALAENMPSGTAIRVSDVLTHRGGKTVEVMNTDAEGRLVLADALAYGAEQAPDAMIDVATLTGAQVVALGAKIAGLMGSDAALVEALQAAAEQAGELVWPLPLHSEYAEQLRSDVADLKNIGKSGAGAITAGLFLKEFTADVPWAHLDIAGPAFSEEGDSCYTAKGGTGVMVRTLVRYLGNRAAGQRLANGPA